VCISVSVAGLHCAGFGDIKQFVLDILHTENAKVRQEASRGLFDLCNHLEYDHLPLPLC
jgi:hypothetical protein